jgi:DNA polymerase-3 subunit delta'
LLIRGPQGIGKLALARALANALLCESPGPDGAACGTCVACGWTGQGNHPDFRMLEPPALSVPEDDAAAADKRERGAAQIPVEQARALSELISVSSHRGGARIVLIHPAESLNVHAANALLKNLEEPPPRMYFLLVSHRWHHLLPTIKSRCQQLALPLPPAAVAGAWLRRQGVPDAELALAQAGGAPLMAAAFDDDYWKQRGEFLDAISRKGFDALALAERLRDQPPGRVLGWLQRWAFDLALHAATGKVGYNPDRTKALAAASGNVGLLGAVRFLRHVVRLQRVVHHPLNPRLFLEDLLLGYAALLKGERPIQAF